MKEKQKKPLVSKTLRPRQYNDKGITLIALVITIIVLLILAAVSIATLSGENGILNMASRASRETNKSSAKERIELEVMGSINDGMSLDVGKLNENLKKNIPELKHEGKSLDDNPIEKLPTIVELDGFTFEIDEDGNVTILEGITLSKKSVELQIITNGSEKKNEEETITATLTGISGSITWTTTGDDAIKLEQLEGGKSVKITAKSEGSETITATCSGKTAECKVTVKNVTAVKNINLDPKEKTINEGEEFTIEATTDGTEKIKWEQTSGDAKIIITPEGEGNKKCKIVAQKEGTAEVAATAAYGESKKCTITVKSPYIDNSYVQYDVEYTDVYTETKYTKNTGWRLLTDLSKHEEQGTYTGGIEIISTGIPAKLYYYYSDVSKASWTGTPEQRKKFVQDYYSYNNSEENNNIYAAAGLLNNFEKIIFKSTLTTGSGNVFENSDTHNYGGYIEIKNKGKIIEANDKTTGEKLFKTDVKNGEVTGIRSVHLGDIKGENNEDTNTTAITKEDDKKPGLFKLNDYTPDAHTTSRYYWLASPNPSSSYYLRYVSSYGYINS